MLRSANYVTTHTATRAKPALNAAKGEKSRFSPFGFPHRVGSALGSEQLPNYYIEGVMNIPEISVRELQALREAGVDFFLLDVRNQDEYDICNLGGHLIPFAELVSRIHELNPDQHIIIHCHAGGRSRRATEVLISQGFKKVSNLRGGITAWANEIDPNMPKY